MNGAEGDALRLVYRTELNREGDRPRFYGPYDFDPLVEGITRTVCLREYGAGVVEMGFSSVLSSGVREEEGDAKASPDSGDLSPEESAQRDRANLDRSVHRSKAQVRRKCMAGGLDHLLTLTYRENVTDPDRAWHDFKSFLRGVRKHISDFPYVAVLEFQKRGACHVHMAVRGFQNVRLLRAMWLAVVEDGNVDVKGPRSRGSVLWQLPKLAGYLSKYITKAVEGLTGRQRYRVSQGIEIPSRTFVYVVRRGVCLVSEIFASLGVSTGFIWNPENSPHGWACSWR